MLSAAQARRVAIAATGLGERRPSATITTRHLRKVLDRVGLLQLDSVNAVARAHELVLFSRLGPFDPALLHRLAYEARELYECWLHVATLAPASMWPMLEWKRTRSRHVWRAGVDVAELDEVRRIVRDQGATAPSDIEHLKEGGGSWWGWSKGKRAMEALFATGELAVSTRRRAFERVYDLTERVLPPPVLDAPVVAEAESRRALLLLAAAHLGVGTAADLADYHRQQVTAARPHVRDLVAEGELVPVEVAGWKDTAYALPSMTVPRRGCPDGRLVSPFDPLVWFRPRNERLFDFSYSIEIYTPKAKRLYGYYVLPYLQGDRIVARVDVRSDRRAGVLRVPGVFAEPRPSGAGSATHDAVVDPALLLAELRRLAEWQGCSDVEIGEKGDLAAPLRRVRA